MNDELDSILTGSLRERARHVSTQGPGFGDVRRRVRRRRQRHVAIGLLPGLAGVGWIVSRPVADDPLRPADGALPTTCDTEAGAAPTSPSSTIQIFDGPANPDVTVSLPAVATSTTFTFVTTAYVVQEGDSWNKIAEMHGPDLEVLLAVNGRSGMDPNASVGAAGDVIAIPSVTSLPNTATSEVPPVDCVVVSPTTVSG